jgi:cytochrome P450
MVTTMTAPRKVPLGPKGHWLWGNLPAFRRDRLGFLTECAQTYGDLVALRFGPRRLLLVNHPDLVEEVLVTKNRSYIKHFALRATKTTLGKGLMMEAVLLLTTIARRFRLALAPATAVKLLSTMTLRADGGIPMVLSERGAGARHSKSLS